MAIRNIRKKIISDVVTTWEKEGSVITDVRQYKALDNPAVHFQLIRKYVGSYTRAVRWASRWYPERVEKLGGLPEPVIEEPVQVIEQPVIEPVVEEPITESDSTSLPPFWAESVEEPKDE